MRHKNFEIYKRSFDSSVIVSGNKMYLYYRKDHAPSEYKKRPCKMYIVQEFGDKYAIYSFHKVVDVIYNTHCNNRLAGCKSGYYFVLEKPKIHTYRDYQGQPPYMARAVAY